jgi:hypothetical protein
LLLFIEDKVPVVTETLPPHDGDSRTQSQEEIQSSTVTEETPEEKGKKIQGNQVFYYFISFMAKNHLCNSCTSPSSLYRPQKHPLCPPPRAKKFYFIAM